MRVSWLRDEEKRNELILKSSKNAPNLESFLFSPTKNADNSLTALSNGVK